jgi:hypothetical protein
VVPRLEQLWLRRHEMTISAESHKDLCCKCCFVPLFPDDDEYTDIDSDLDGQWIFRVVIDDSK